MRKQALVLGLTAVLFALPFDWIFDLLVDFTSLSIPSWILIPAMLAGAFFLALKLAPRVEGEDVPSVWFIVLLRITAGFYLLVQLLWLLSGLVSLGGFVWRLYSFSNWAMIITALLTTRFLKRRLMLFIGLVAFALQFKVASFLALVSAPKSLIFLAGLIIAVLVARPFCAGNDSAADRAPNPLHLWFFSAAATLVMLTMRESMLLRTNTEIVVWLAFLVSFVVFARGVYSADLRQSASAEQPTPGRIFVIFVSLLVVVATIFQVQEFVDRKMSWSAGDGLHLWLPLLVSSAVTVAIMVALGLGSRVPAPMRGYKLMLWAVIFCGIVSLSSVGLMGSIAGQDQLGQLLGVVIWLALLAAPLLAAAQILAGIGLLRLLFEASQIQRR